MDEYGKYYYIREPQNKNIDPGNITSQLQLRERLHCKSFKWCVLFVYEAGFVKNELNYLRFDIIN